MTSVGIDVSKGKSVACIMEEGGKILCSKINLEHTEQGITDFISRLKFLDGEVKVVMEATGVYHLPLLTSLNDAGIFVSVINPLIMKKYSSTSIRKGKTDKLDAVKIANYGIDKWFRLERFTVSAAVYDELKLLGRQYSHYISMRISGKQTLLDILDRTMPGIRNLLCSKNPDEPTKDKLNDFVMEYWHYDNITKMEEDEFVESYHNWAKRKGYRFSEVKAKAIYSLAQSGIPTLSSAATSTKMLTLEASRVLSEISKSLKIILTQLQTLASTLPEYSVIRSMPGVGSVLAPRFIAEIGDVRRFHNGSALIAYAGIDSPPFQSGSFTGTKRSISKRGSPLLRKTGYEIMKCIKTIKPTVDDAVYKFMLKKEGEGKPKKVAKIAGLNKFLRIYYARVRAIYQSQPYSAGLADSF